MANTRVKVGELLLLLIPLFLVIWHWPWWVALFQGDASVALDALGRLAGVLGLGLMLLAGLSSVRIPKLDRWFGGLPHLWRMHRWMGFLGFILVLVHVWSMAFSAVPYSLSASLRTLAPPLSDWAVWMGWLALLFTLGFLAPTFQFFGHLNYQRWKRLHLLSAPALAAALVHTLPLAHLPAFWWALGGLAFAAIGWRKILSPHWGRSNWTVARVDALAPGVVELVLDPVDKPLSYEPGQFVYLTPQVPALSAGYKEEHPFTISSAPLESQLKLGIKDLGDASHALQQIPVGSRVQVEGPYGDFYQRNHPARHQLWLGGGIGITPFVSGARALAEHQTDDIRLIYLAQDESRSYYLDELKAIAERCPGFTAQAHFFRSEGPMTLAYLKQHCPDLQQREVYLCGPPGMVDHLLPMLHAVGMPRSAIHSEVFDFL